MLKTSCVSKELLISISSKQWADAMAATLRDLYPKAKIETDFADYKKTMLMDASYGGAVSIVDESMGCFGYEVKRPREDHCTASVDVFTPKEKLTHLWHTWVVRLNRHI